MNLLQCWDSIVIPLNKPEETIAATTIFKVNSLRINRYFCNFAAIKMLAIILVVALLNPTD